MGETERLCSSVRPASVATKTQRNAARREMSWVRDKIYSFYSKKKEKVKLGINSSHSILKKGQIRDKFSSLFSKKKRSPGINSTLKKRSIQE